MGPVPRVPVIVPLGGHTALACSSRSASRKNRVPAGGGAMPFLCRSALIVLTPGTRKSQRGISGS